MKIQELSLTAFGPFTDRTLDFDLEADRLHIVYGPNEAGKSSALRGLKALLYGIEVRTLDNFLHPNDKLRIRGCVRNSDGEKLVFARRKGRKNTLLSMHGESLDQHALAPFLQGVTPDLFETLFGIDHQALVQGGQEILEQRGEVGQALFSAALGSHALHMVLAQLDNEADGLFRPRGSTQTINSDLKSFTELNKEIRDRALSSRVWDKHRRALGRTSTELARIQSELAGNRLEVNRLKRIQRLLPKLARRRELLTELESLRDIVILPDDFSQRRQRAAKALETARAIVGKAEPRLDGLQTQLEGLSVSQPILDQAEIIEELHARLGSHRKALQDRPHLESERRQLLSDAEFLLKQVRPDLDFIDLERIRPMLARRQNTIELGNEKAVLRSRLEQAASSRRETEIRLKIAREERDKLPDLGTSAELRRTIAAARKLGDMDTAIQSGQTECAGLETQCAAALSRLTLWDGELMDLPGLGVPSRESVERFEQAYAEFDIDFQRLREKRESAADALQDASRRLDEIQRVGTVPTEAELIEIRSDRDRIWQLIRSQWVDGEGVSRDALQPDTKGVLPELFEERLADADELSDRLRREADRVHAMAGLQAKQESMRLHAAELDRQRESYTAERQRIDEDWKLMWASCRIQPRTPREMRVWIDDLEKLRDRVEQLNLHRRKIDEQEQIRSSHIHLLYQQLEALGKGRSKSETLEIVLQECESAAQQLDEITQKRAALDKVIKALETDLESLTAESQLAMNKLAAWKAQWCEGMKRFGLQEDTSPSEVAEFIEKVRELFAKTSDAEKLQIRIKAIDSEAEAFRNQVADVAASIAPELAERPADDGVIRLNALLLDNRTRLTRRKQIEQQIEQARQEIQESKSTIQTMTDRLDSLCAEAKCGRHAELEEAERNSRQRIGVKESIDTIEHEILEAGEGATISELEVEADGIDPDALPGRIEELNNSIDDELEPKRIDLAQTKGRETKELELMDGGDQVAALADRAQAILAGIRSDTERYVRVKLAGRILRDEIERYRKENQGPLVRRASEHFAALTLNSFQGLMTDFNAQDEPVLAGIRPDGERVYVEGMSSGTRDQLYLALRLASLEKYMESAEPMPFIVDDVLVDFDDRRSEAALNALAVLAQKTQVILFTHHSRVVEQARRLSGGAQVEVHEL